MKKFRKQFKDLSSVVDLWWLWVLESLSRYALSDSKQDWLMYNSCQLFTGISRWRTRFHPQHRNKYKKAWEKALAAKQVHPLSTSIPADEIEQWCAWASFLSRKFHRSSSAVEGVQDA